MTLELFAARSKRTLVSALCAVFLCPALASKASAEVTISGTPEDLKIAAENHAVEDILDQLSEKFGLRHVAKIKLDTQVSGVYTGSLTEVARRLLANYDYVLTSKEDTNVLLITGVHGRSGVAAVPSQVPPKAAVSKTPPRVSEEPAAKTPVAAPVQSANAAEPKDEPRVAPAAPNVQGPAAPVMTVGGVPQESIAAAVQQARGKLEVLTKSLRNVPR